MLSILSGLLGFLSSGLPSILGFFQDRADKSHELSVMQMQLQAQLEAQKAGFASQEKIAEIEYESGLVDAQIREREALYKHDEAILSRASQSIVDLNGKVRPYIAFIFVGELVVINLISLAWAMWTGVPFMTALDLVFSNEEMAITVMIINFYYGKDAWDSALRKS